MRVLSRLLLRVVEEGLSHGFKVARNVPSISHLFFADDSFLFCKANLNEARVIRDILESYCQMSRQLVNYRKSAVYFNNGTSRVRSRELTNVRG